MLIIKTWMKELIINISNNLPFGAIYTIKCWQLFIVEPYAKKMLKKNKISNNNVLYYLSEIMDLVKDLKKTKSYFFSNRLSKSITDFKKNTKCFFSSKY